MLCFLVLGNCICGFAVFFTLWQIGCSQQRHHMVSPETTISLGNFLAPFKRVIVAPRVHFLACFLPLPLPLPSDPEPEVPESDICVQQKCRQDNSRTGDINVVRGTANKGTTLPPWKSAPQCREGSPSLGGLHHTTTAPNSSSSRITFGTFGA